MPDREIEALAEEAFRRGDIDVFTQFVREHETDVLRYAFRLVGNREDAQDLTQEAFLRAYRTREQVTDTPGNYVAWVFCIVRNLCIDHLRKKRAPAMEQEELEEQPDPEALAPEEVYQRRVEAQTVRQCLEELPGKYREVLVLRYLSDLPYEQVAEVLGVPVSTIETRLHRAHRKLREKLQGRL